MNILITGSKGFVGKNLTIALRRRHDLTINEFDVDSSPEKLNELLPNADIIFHLAGVNRPQNVDEFKKVNADLSRQICDTLREYKRKPLVIFSSSTQAALENPYGASKRIAEEEFFKLNRDSGVPVAIYRLPGVFGKWCRPNYNSVVATFCYNIANGIPINISDPDHSVNLVYIDDVVGSFLQAMDGKIKPGNDGFYAVNKTHTITLGRLADAIHTFRKSRETLQVSDFSDHFIKCLYASYTSYLPTDDFAYSLDQRVDQRGELAELLKSSAIGQIFVSRTRPGITRGNHFHDTKVEKFVVLEGEAVIRFRHIGTDVRGQGSSSFAKASVDREVGGTEIRNQRSEVIEYRINGRDFKVVDIPAGYTHSIENIGSNDLIVLFWADEIFDPDKPDTYYEEV
jgi:UDP-2-acetamido-2,6-beta-L-arabino-hexul-4-ose reductase